MQKLFNNEKLKDEVALTDHIPCGQVGQVGVDNILYSKLIRQFGGTLVKRFINVNSEQTFAVPANCVILSIDFKSSGTSTIEVTRDIAGDIVEETTFSQVLNNTGFYDFETSDNITIAISGDTVTVVIKYLYNYW